MIIKEEFKKLIPPLAIEEFNQLEKNIIADGCRDSLLIMKHIADLSEDQCNNLKSFNQRNSAYSQ